MGVVMVPQQLRRRAALDLGVRLLAHVDVAVAGDPQEAVGGLGVDEAAVGGDLVRAVEHGQEVHL